MKPQGWFQKDKSSAKRPSIVGGPAAPRTSEASRLAAKLRPQELIAMLTHHYPRARARTRPRVRITIAVSNPAGKQAVIVACE
jgi:hypothetical protein